MPGFEREVSGTVTHSLLLRDRFSSENLLLFKILVVLFLALKELLKLELSPVVEVVDLGYVARNLSYVYHFFEVNLFKGVVLHCKA